MKKFQLLTLALLPLTAHSYRLQLSQEQTANKTIQITTDIELDPNELIYEDQILVSVDHPYITLSPHKINKQPTLSYDAHLNDNVHVFSENFSITTLGTYTGTIVPDNAHIHIILASNQHPSPQEELMLLEFSNEDVPELDVYESQASTETISTKQRSYIPETINFFKKISSYKNHLQNKFSTTDSIAIKIFLAFLLGLLLSMTPCIYPMIPITAGVLQANAGSSLWKNFLLALCYTVGLGTTFALMGLLAASSGQALGNIMMNPFFVVAIVTFLAYFAFSLFGCYNLYIPRFMQQKMTLTKTSSPLSIFLFGMGSGSVASPCVSPGLALILANVATMASKLLGFVLLFSFGFGISTPLIIIGTFSGSLNMLPRAGMWMLEIQKIFGFMLLGMCFYYLSNILPWFVILCMLAIFFLIVGLHYLKSIRSTDSGLTKLIKNGVGMGCIIGAIFITSQAIQEKYYPEDKQSFEATWYTDYDKAITDANAQNKLIFMDFWTPYCSICKEITKKVIKHPDVQKMLQDRYIVLAVDASDNEREPYKTLRETYKVWGAPNIFIIDPASGEILKHWQSELYETSIPTVLDELQKHQS